MDKIINVLMNLINVALQKEEIDIEQYHSLSQEEKNHLFKLCSKHSISVIVGDVLGKSNLVEKTPDVKKIMTNAFIAVYRYEQSKIEINKITNVLSELKIPYIVLKGPRVREYYPEPWLRTSCDIDILIHEKDIDLAVNELVQRCSYSKQERNFHDVPLITPNHLLLELHFNIKENMTNLDKILTRVWNYSFPVNHKDCMEYQQSNEFFIFHLLAHMSYHFLHGGCGIRSVLDIYLINHNMQYNKDQLKLLCKEAEIETFYEYVIQLSEVWFGENEHNEVTLAMEKYILHGGTFGTNDNSIAVGQLKNGGHKKYIFSRLFVSYNHLKGLYPSIEKYKFMKPLYQVKRWISMIKNRKLKRYVNELKLSRSITQEQLNSTKKLLKALNLN